MQPQRTDWGSGRRYRGWRRSPAVGVAAAGLIVFAVVSLVSWARGPKPVTYTRVFQCASCGHVEELPLWPAVKPPAVCGRCGKESLCSQYRCGACGHHFAWTCPPDPGELDEDALPADEAARRKAIDEYDAKVKAAGEFFLPCPSCASENIFEEWTDSHKAIMVKYQKYLSDHTKGELAKRYEIKF